MDIDSRAHSQHHVREVVEVASLNLHARVWGIPGLEAGADRIGNAVLLFCLADLEAGSLQLCSLPYGADAVLCVCSLRDLLNSCIVPRCRL